MDILTEGVDFIIHRYSQNNWPTLRGRIPYIVTGPRFLAWAIPGSLERFGEWRFRPSLMEDLRDLDVLPLSLGREVAAELLLTERICQAIWAVNVRTAVDPSLRWSESLREMAREIPNAAPLSGWIIELLSGMSDVSYYRSYLSESGIVFESAEVPADV